MMLHFINLDDIILGDSSSKKGDGSSLFLNSAIGEKFGDGSLVSLDIRFI